VGSNDGDVDVGVEGVHVDMSVGARHAQVPLRREDGGAEARGSAHSAGGPGGNAAGTRRRQATTQGRRDRIAYAAGQVQRVREEETGTGDEDEGMRGETRPSWQGRIS